MRSSKALYSFTRDGVEKNLQLILKFTRGQNQNNTKSLYHATGLLFVTIFMGKIFSLANQKGGVGKTTTTINLGAFLADLGKKVLIVDIDPQGNAGSGLGLDVMKLKPTIYEVLIGKADLKSALKKSKIEGLDILPSNINLSGLEIDVRDDKDTDYILKKLLNTVKADYDYILIDCPPSLGLLTINSLAASDSVLIPLQCEYFALEGLTQLLRIIKLAQNKLNNSLVLEGVLLTMYDSRTRLSAQVVQDVKEHFKHQVFEVIIPRNVKLTEAPSFGQPIGQYEPHSTGATAYKKFAKELIERTNGN